MNKTYKMQSSIINAEELGLGKVTLTDECMDILASKIALAIARLFVAERREKDDFVYERRDENSMPL